MDPREKIEALIDEARDMVQKRSWQRAIEFLCEAIRLIVREL